MSYFAFYLEDFEYSPRLERKIYKPSMQDASYVQPFYMYCIAAGTNEALWIFVDDTLYFPDTWMGMKYVKTQCFSRDHIHELVNNATVGQRIITHDSHVIVS